MDIAFLTGIDTRSVKGGGGVHAQQVSRGLLGKGHRLYTNLEGESEDFRKFRHGNVRQLSRNIDVFYIRIDGAPEKDRWTMYRRFNPKAICLWEVNAPVEELHTRKTSEKTIDLYNRKRRLLAKFVDAAICVSDEMGEYARSELGINRIFVVPNGSDQEIFSPKMADPLLFDNNKFKIIWTGSSEYTWQGLRKVEILADKIYSVDREILFIVTADGTSKNNIRYVGKVPYKVIPKYIASVDAGLCIYDRPGYYDKFYFSPLKLFDYMSCSIPVIGSNVGQIRQILEEYRNGLLVGNSIQDMIDGILFLKSNKDVAKEMGERGRKAVLERYSWSNVVNQTEKIMLDLMSSAGGSLASRKMKFLLTRQHWVLREAYWEMKNRCAAMLEHESPMAPNE